MRSQGVYTALITPMDAQGNLDWDSLASILDLQVQSGVTGIVLCGSTGEGHAFTESELWKILSFSIERCLDKIEVVMGLPTNSTRQAVAWASHAKQLGATGCLLATPYYNKPTQQGMIAHYTSICKVGLPVMAYNVPSRTSSELSPHALEKLALVSHFSSLKDSGGCVDGFSRLMSTISCKILCGNDSQTLPWMALGSTGVVSVSSNVLPKQIVALYDLCEQHQWVRAKKLHYQLFPFHQSLFSQTNPIPVKWVAFKKKMISSAHVRLPLVSLEDSQLQEKIWADFLLGDGNA